jgi:hypothetical protein
VLIENGRRNDHRSSTPGHATELVASRRPVAAPQESIGSIELGGVDWHVGTMLRDEGVDHLGRTLSLAK